MKKSTKKIDEHGDYCPFAGITVIAGVLEGDSPLWLRVNDIIAGSELIRRYFSALPYESYHMTTTDLFTEPFDGGDDWEAFVHNKMPFFQALHAKLEEKQITPTIKIEHIHLSSVIQLVLSIPEEQRRQTHEIATEFGIQDKVPRTFHMTLAYQYQPLPPDDAKVIQQHIQHYIQHRLNHLLKEHPHDIHLKSPALSTFNDMASFHTWNGEEYPFDTSYPEHEASPPKNN